jgi:sec-independent protein translocase protein TatC
MARDDNSATAQDSSEAVATSSNEIFDPATMTVIEHLDELRTRIIRSLVVIGLSFGICLFFGKDLVRILEHPAGNITFQALSMEEPLLVYFKISFYAAVALACPYLLFELGQFIKPGLRKNEQMILAPIVFGGPFLFAMGVAFAYFFILPPMLHFFGSFGEGISPIHQRLDFYMSLVCSILLYMGLCFQLPLVLFGLSFTGLVNSKLLLSIWRYAVFSAALVAAIITPDPTAISMLMVMGALVGLYFFSIALLKVFGR